MDAKTRGPSLRLAILQTIQCYNYRNYRAQGANQVHFLHVSVRLADISDGRGCLTNFIHLCTADTNAAAKTTPWERVNTTWRSVRCWWIVSNVPKTGLLLITRYAIVSSCSMRGVLGRVSCISVFDLVAGWMLPVSITA